MLNRQNPREYVLVYNSGAVYYNFHEDFVESFKAVIDEWSEGMRSSGRPDHRPSFPFETLEDDDGDSLDEETHNVSTGDDDSDGDHGILKPKKSPAKPSPLRRASSHSQPQATISSSRSYSSNVSGKDASENSQPLKTVSGDATAVSDQPVQAEAEVNPSNKGKAPVTRSSSVAPERVPNQPRSPLNEAEEEEEENPVDPSPPPHRARTHTRLQSLREGIRDFFT